MRLSHSLCSPLGGEWKKHESEPSKLFRPSSVFLEAWLWTTSNSTTMPIECATSISCFSSSGVPYRLQTHIHRRVLISHSVTVPPTLSVWVTCRNHTDKTKAHPPLQTPDKWKKKGLYRKSNQIFLQCIFFFIVRKITKEKYAAFIFQYNVRLKSNQITRQVGDALFHYFRSYFRIISLNTSHLNHTKGSWDFSFDVFYKIYIF